MDFEKLFNELEAVARPSNLDETRAHMGAIALELLRLDRDIWSKREDEEGKPLSAAGLATELSCSIHNAQAAIGLLDQSIGDDFSHRWRYINAWIKAAKGAIVELQQHVAARQTHPLNDINVRKQVWQLTGGKCAYCECDLAPWGNETADSFAVEHVVPRSQGGPDNLANYVPACRSCNVSKKDGHVLDFIQRKLRRNLRVIDGDKNAAGGTD